jgi:hypothetical protein
MTEKLRVLESSFLGTNYTSAEQILATISQTIEVAQIPLNGLPHSVVPTELLYHIALGYTLMYNKLMDTELLSDGQHKQHKTIN